MKYEDNYLLNYSNDIIVGNLEEKVENISLTQSTPVLTGGITGTVIDTEANPVSDATVKVFDLLFNPIKHTMTNADGTYSISGLEPGDYIVYSIKDGYEISTKVQVNIQQETVVLENIVISPNILYTKGSVYGIVYDKTTNSPLANVKITLRNITDLNTIVAQTYSADDGEYVLYDLDAGTYQISALNDDYTLTVPFNITIIDNTNLKEKLYLDKLYTAKEGTINGIVKDKVTDVPIEGAFVGLYIVDEVTKEETLVKITTTNREGKYFFGYVPSGKYIVKAKSVK